MRYETLPLLRTFDLCFDLARKQYEEVGLTGLPLDPQRDVYAALDAVSLSFAIVAFDGDDPVGYCTVFISRHPHTDGLFAANDLIFCLPDYRPRGVGGRLIVLAEREAKRRGCVAFQWQSPMETPLHIALRRRWDPVSDPQPLITFIRRLNHG